MFFPIFSSCSLLQVSIASDILYALLNQLEKESMDEKLALLLAELYLALVKHCGK